MDYSSDACWLTPDPMGGDMMNPQSLNRYGGVYPERSRRVTNNPATLTDPLGLQGYNAGDRCSDPSYAVSHAECEGPGYAGPCTFYSPCLGGCADIQQRFLRHPASYDNFALDKEQVRRCPIQIDCIRLPLGYRG
jgi:hypothetical protein